MFRIVLCTALSFFTINAQADVFDEIESCKMQCSQECKDLSKNLKSAMKGLDSSCGNPKPSRGVKVYHSDSCSSSLIATLTPFSDCNNFNDSGNEAWGVEVRGKCYNIPDTSMRKACAQFAGGATKSPAKIFHSDSCSSSLIAMIGHSSQCDLLEGSGSRAWGVEVDGKCHNISDTSPKSACQNFKGAGSGYGVKIFKSDSCSSSLVAIVSPRSKCNLLKDTGSDAWGVEINGACENISDMSIADACEKFKAGNF